MINVLIVFSQEQDYLPFYTPPSPNTYELGKYGQIPVGMFTGTPIFDLPLYQYKTRNLTVPISISYFSNGIKVDQVESKVGLGWSLNAGGIISRIVRDLPDEEYLSVFPVEEIGDSGFVNPSTAQFFHDASSSDDNDTETDLFMYNFLGKSGKFIYDNTKRIIQMPYSDLNVEPIYIDEYNFGFIVTTSDGVKYFFTQIETTWSLVLPFNNHPLPNFVKTAWYLTKIIHPNGDEIYFTYEAETYSFTSSISQTVEVLYPPSQEDKCGNSITMVPDSNLYNNYSTVNGWNLKEISSNVHEFGKMKFSLANSGQNGIPNYSLFSSISVINKDSNEIEKIDFRYQFNPVTKRVFLDSIRFMDQTRNFKFDYIDPSSLVSRLSFQQDHWGYYNGANSNQWFVPTIDDDAFNNFNIGANREPDTNYAKIGLLAKIKYPTKGTTELIYEPNTYYGEKINYGPLTELYLETHTNQYEFGGARVCSIKCVKVKSIKLNNFDHGKSKSKKTREEKAFGRNNF